MLPQQGRLLLSNHTDLYDLIIGQDNLLCQIKELIDFSFVRKELVNKCRLRLTDMDLLNLLINKTVTIAIEKGIIKSHSIIVDATHTGSRSNPHAPVKMRSKQLRRCSHRSQNQRQFLLWF
jgi:hypothetical protein